MALSSPRPKISDGIIVFATVCLMGAPEVLGPHIPHVVGVWMFYAGLAGLFIYPTIRIVGWLLSGASSNDEHQHRQDSTGKNSPNISSGGNVSIGHIGDIINHPPENTSLLAAQIGEIQKLHEFIGGKDEVELRELFDFPDILKFNVRGFKDAAQSPSLKPLPKRPFVNTSKKYANNQKILFQFESSLQLPQSVHEGVAALNKAVSDNATILIEVLNERVSQNRSNIIENDDISSPRFGNVNNAYWHRFIQLRPLVDRILAAARSSLKVQ